MFFQGAKSCVWLGGHSKFLGLLFPMGSVYKYPASTEVTDPMFPNNPDPFLVHCCAKFPNLEAQPLLYVLALLSDHPSNIEIL